jgi:hypothetical protein
MTQRIQAPDLESMSHGGSWEIEHFTDLVCRQPQLAQPDDQVPPASHIRIGAGPGCTGAGDQPARPGWPLCIIVHKDIVLRPYGMQEAAQ